MVFSKQKKRLFSNSPCHVAVISDSLGFIPCVYCQISPAVKRLLGSILVALLVAAVRGFLWVHRGGGKCLEGGCNLLSNSYHQETVASTKLSYLTRHVLLFCCSWWCPWKVDITSLGKICQFLLPFQPGFSCFPLSTHTTLAARASTATWWSMEIPGRGAAKLFVFIVPTIR